MSGGMATKSMLKVNILVLLVTDKKTLNFSCCSIYCAAVSVSASAAAPVAPHRLASDHAKWHGSLRVPTRMQVGWVRATDSSASCTGRDQEFVCCRMQYLGFKLWHEIEIMYGPMKDYSLLPLCAGYTALSRCQH